MASGSGVHRQPLGCYGNIDMTPAAGKLAMMWDTTLATAAFSFGRSGT